MQVMMRCIDEGYRVFKSKGVEQKEYVAALVDCGSGVRCTNAFGVVLEGEQKDKYLGKLRDETLILDVNKMQQRFDGEIRLSGNFTIQSNGVVKK